MAAANSTRDTIFSQRYAREQAKGLSWTLVL
jgi:hypothetical protein